MQKLKQVGCMTLLGVALGLGTVVMGCGGKAKEEPKAAEPAPAATEEAKPAEGAAAEPAPAAAEPAPAEGGAPQG